MTRKYCTFKAANIHTQFLFSRGRKIGLAGGDSHATTGGKACIIVCALSFKQPHITSSTAIHCVLDESNIALCLVYSRAPKQVKPGFTYLLPASRFVKLRKIDKTNVFK